MQQASPRALHAVSNRPPSNFHAPLPQRLCMEPASSLTSSCPLPPEHMHRPKGINTPARHCRGSHSLALSPCLAHIFFATVEPRHSGHQQCDTKLQHLKQTRPIARLRGARPYQPAGTGVFKQYLPVSICTALWIRCNTVPSFLAPQFAWTAVCDHCDCDAAHCRMNGNIHSFLSC